MPLIYPINLIGFDEGFSSGNVLAISGRCLGTWVFTEDPCSKSGKFSFFVEGETEPRFTEVVGDTDSGTSTVIAMSKLCRSILSWYQCQDELREYLAIE